MDPKPGALQCFTSSYLLTVLGPFFAAGHGFQAMLDQGINVWSLEIRKVLLQVGLGLAPLGCFAGETHAIAWKCSSNPYIWDLRMKIQPAFLRGVICVKPFGGKDGAWRYTMFFTWQIGFCLLLRSSDECDANAVSGMIPQKERQPVCIEGMIWAIFWNNCFTHQGYAATISCTCLRLPWEFMVFMFSIHWAVIFFSLAFQRSVWVKRDQSHTHKKTDLPNVTHPRNNHVNNVVIWMQGGAP